MSKYKKLFEPIKVGNTEVKNRIVMAPLATGGLLNSDGTLTPRVVEYYRHRIMGGIGMLISGVAKVENEVEKIIIGHNGRLLISPLVIPRMAEVAELCHYYNVKYLVQAMAGDGYNNPEKDIVSASVTPTYFREEKMTRELTVSEIKRIVKSFGKAAKILNCLLVSSETDFNQNDLL